VSQTATPVRTATVGTQRTRANRIYYLLGGVLGLGLALPVISSALGLYDTVQHWGKLVHAVDGLCAAFTFGLLFIGWRAQARVDLTDELAALVTMFSGVLFGVLWEIVEFLRDWVAYSDLQKSNNDTMTDFLCNDVAVVVAALLAMRVYCHVLSPAERQRLGATAEWLVDGPSRLLDRHGLALTAITLGLIAASVLSLWLAGRPVPGIPIP
jgi:hypothetical protein